MQHGMFKWALSLLTSGPVRRRLCLVAATAALAVLVAGTSTQVVAQDLRQMQLTEAQIKGFIASQKELAGFADKLQAAGDKLDDKLQGELDAIAKKHGFKDFAELDDVAANISIVMAGIDPQSGDYVDPVKSLQEELDDVKKDETIAADEKKQLVAELEEAIKSTPPLEHKDNIALVVKHREAIEKALE
ncbi:MAG: hypothetical protein NW205_14180 [Hyphomicrobiaceae bacterium]|nr:hypothetical protein [Hyphomicrobiaceae bacterium]